MRVYRDHQAGPAQTLSLMVGSSDASLIRTETLAGREYTVVPCIALVEGVLQGANSTEPEFAAAAEFGRFPQGWNGRPVVLRHPQINGVFVSASLPTIFEDFHMGSLFNSKLEDKKLKTEAWLDNARILELGGEFLETLTALQNGDVINVSVGAFIETRAAHGTYGGKQYQSRWDTVVPDHLALLPDELGACSVADGCGTNRVASAAVQPIETRSLQYLTEGCGGHCCDACAQGEPCMATASAGAEAPNGGGGTPTPTPTPSPQPGQPATPTPTTPAPVSPTPTTPTPAPATGEVGESQAEAPTPEVLAAMARAGEQRLDVLQGLAANALGNEVVLDDAQRLVAQALPARLGVESWAVDLLAATTDQAVYMAWGEPNMKGFFQIGYSVNNSGAVNFTGEPEPVNLMVRIMPRQTGEVSANSGSTVEEDGAMAEAGQGGIPANAAGTESQPGTATAPVVEPNVQAEPEATLESVDSYIAKAPAELQGVLRRAVQRDEAHKQSLIAGIKTNSRNRFSDEQLAAMDLPQLEGLAALAEVPSFEGRGNGFDPDPLNVNTRPVQVSTFMEADQDYLLDQPAGNA
jgi:hypothetical protein